MKQPDTRRHGKETGLGGGIAVATIAGCGAIVCVTGIAAAQVWNANADFSGTNNPAGAWSYGITASRLGTFEISTSTGSIGAVIHWGAGAPGVWKNFGSTGVLIGDNPVLPPGVLMAHPGPNGENAVLRWTSPYAGSVRAVVRFGGVVIDPDADSVDVAVVRNGVVLFAQYVDGVGAAADYSTELGVNVGDTLDFHVGFGDNGTYFNDSTALSVVVTNCPTIVTQPVAQSACVAGSVSMSVGVSLLNGATFRWQYRAMGTTAWIPLDDGGVFGLGGVSGAYNSQLSIDHLYGSGGAVRCVVTGLCGTVTSNAASLFVSPADLGVQGGLPGRDGLLDNNDFIAFINLFFAQDARADLGSVGGVLGADGQFDNNDFIVFIDRFFAGC